MADIVNLRQHRKHKARDEKAKKADANRIAFGRTREERELSKAAKEMEDRKLAGHRLAQDMNKIGTEAEQKDGGSLDRANAAGAKAGKEAESVTAEQNDAPVCAIKKSSDTDDKILSDKKRSDNGSNIVSLSPDTRQ
ncbi:DUF4169 family protein [Thalassospira profundimaris]|uniref:DUF4169 family protein n=1 Tax=Thalassospira profundimaris TaxID=502049 RepID=UPI000DED6868|nr:DUF4169 family protein [Thalassospira profundimaris]